MSEKLTLSFEQSTSGFRELPTPPGVLEAAESYEEPYKPINDAQSHDKDARFRSWAFDGDNPPGLLAERLAHGGDFNQALRDFNAGDAEVRDVGRFTERGRMATINAGRLVYEHGRTINGVLVNNPFAIQSINRATESFRYAMTSGDPNVQEYAGWNFTVNMKGFSRANLPWATQVDAALGDYLSEVSGISIRSGLNAMIHKGVENDDVMRTVWHDFTMKNPLLMAWNLAERSQFSENYQADLFTREMVQAKTAASKQILRMAEQYNLPQEYLNRALQQLHGAKFSAFDHLVGGIDAGDGVLGSFRGGTMRVQTNLGGTTRNPGDAPDALGTTTHELFHCTSAQLEGRVGLRDGEYGRDPNEGLTELFNKLSLGRVVIQGDTVKFYDVHHGQLMPAQTYDAQVKGAFTLMHNQPEQFAALFRAYYGYVPDKSALHTGLAAFNDSANRFVR